MIPVTVTFYGDVGFDRSYNHVIDFSNETERDNYFSSRILKTIQNCAYDKPMNSLQIRCPYEEALNFTYCKFIIGSNINSRKTIFGWVDDVILITDQKDENNTFVPILQINISIDPWQTFLFNFTLGESFVVREHVDRFKPNSDGTRGWCLPTTSDNNNVAVEKRTRDLINFNKIYDFTIQTETFPSHRGKIFWVVIQRVYNNEMEVLLIPTIGEDGGFYIKDSSTNYDVMLIPTSNIYDDTFLTDLNIDPETVASAYYIPYDVADFTWDGSSLHINSKIYDAPDLDGFGKRRIDTTYNHYFYYKSLFYYYDDFTDRTFKLSREFTLDSYGVVVPNQATLFSRNYEPQLFKSPYKRVSVIDEHGIERGQLPDICNNIQNGYQKIIVETLIDSVECRIRIKPKISIETNSEYWIDYELTSIDVIRNAWLSYLLQERETTRQMISSQINQQAIASAIGGVTGGIAQGGGMAVSQGLAAGGAGLAIGLGTSAINTIANYKANQHFMFEQQDIREKQIRRKANNVTQSGTFKSRIGFLRLCVIECDETTLDIKAKEYHKYGYSVFFYETPNLKTRKYFNFIATNIVKINGNLNNSIKMALMEVFNKGVTIWHGDYIHELTGIGDYSKENIERSLIT